MKENTTLWIVITIITLHFVIGVGLLICKILGANLLKSLNSRTNQPLREVCVNLSPSAKNLKLLSLIWTSFAPLQPTQK
jgi:hypothetical protein